MSLEPPIKVRRLQAALHAKAKGSPSYRFYLLYDKLYREDVLEYAYRLCAANGGAAGVDGQRFEDIESQGREQWLGELAEELRERRYRPQISANRRTPYRPAKLWRAQEAGRPEWTTVSVRSLRKGGLPIRPRFR